MIDARAQQLVNAELDGELESSPEAFTPWLRMEWKTLVGDYAEALSRYADSPTKR